MPMIARTVLNIADKYAAQIHRTLFGEKPALSTFLFHACLPKAGDYERNLIYPQERLTVAQFRNFIQYMLDSGYTFVQPNDIYPGLRPEPHQKLALITFDDGYYNNTHLIPVLEEFEVPALFFVPTAYLYNGKKFWSDALYQARRQQQRSDEEILREVISLKSLRLEQIENKLCQEFGAAILDQSDDFSRFMSEDEFKSFAAHPLVHIGNHTHTHEILTHLSASEVRAELQASQEVLERLLGHKPLWISYPNGSFNNETISIAASMGLDTGISTIMQKNYFPLNNIVANQLLLHRFNPVVENDRLSLDKFKSDFQFKTKLKQWLA